MTGAEGLSESDIHLLEQFATAKSGPHKRKSRLFATACCRRIVRFVRDKRAASLLDVSDEYADGLVGASALAAVRPDPWPAQMKRIPLIQRSEGHAINALSWLGKHDEQFDPGAVARQCLFATDGLTRGQGAEREAQRVLIVDIFGNPFRPVAFDPRWRTADAVGLARGIHEERAFERLPLLADALMDAGCGDEQVLGHCRSAGPHVRGCWVVDLVLGKE